MEVPELSWTQVNFLVGTFVVFLVLLSLFLTALYAREIRLQIGDVRRVLIHRTDLFLDIAEAIRDRNLATDLRLKLDEVILELSQMSHSEDHLHSDENRKKEEEKSYP